MLRKDKTKKERRKRTRGSKQKDERTKSLNDRCYMYMYSYILRKDCLGWVMPIFHCFMHIPLSPRRRSIFIINVPSIARRWQICLKAILLMGRELYDVEKNWQLVACYWKGRRGYRRCVAVWRWKDMIYIIIFFQIATHIYISTHVCNQ